MERSDSRALQLAVAELRFDPRCALEPYRLRGNVMRARKTAYDASANARKAKS